MSEKRFITTLTVLVFMLSGFISWRLLSPEGGSRELSIHKQASILGTNPEASPEPGIIKTISTRSATSIVIASDRNRVAYYERDSGVAFEVGLDGSFEKALSSSRLPNFLSTIWSSNKKEVISEFAAPGSSKYFSYYNYATKKSARLNPKISSVTFSPAGDRIVYYKEDGVGSYGVFVSAPDGSSPQKILTTRLTNARVFWPSANILGLLSSNEDLGSSLFLVSMDGKMTKIISDKAALSVKWSNDGARTLTSYLNDDGKLVLSTITIQGLEEKILPINADASECAWSSNESIVCRVAGNTTEQASTPGLYEVNTKTAFMDYVQGSGPTANGIQEILVDPNNTYILFTDARDGKLFSLRRR